MDFKVLQWIPAIHDQSTMNIALGGPSFYKERLPTTAPVVAMTASPNPAPSPPVTATPAPHASAPSPPTAAIPQHLKPLSPPPRAFPSLMHLRAAMAAHAEIRRSSPHLFASRNT
ncbi:hypothetical protein AX14_009804 [Amanita brunnescens Koide BX004]|nr:hypothetical protein AX14_009804 [Amanita brunnescens Koide BX004]